MENGELGKKVFSGLFWKFGERFLSQAVSFIVTVILARLLLPEDYGVVEIVMIFITLANVFMTSGFSTALIQAEEADSKDFSTIFYCSFAVSLVLYAVLFLAAPLIAQVYRNPVLTAIVRVLSLQVPLSAYNAVQHAYVSRNMLFKRFFFSTLIGITVSGVVGIGMAYMGLGVWALVGQSFANIIVDTLVLGITIPWRLEWTFSKKSAKRLMAYGWKILAADFSGTFFGQLRSLVIGVTYTSADLAFYNKGQHFPQMITNNLSTSVMAVLFPAFSTVGNDIPKVRQMTQVSLRLLTYVMAPVLLGMAAIPEEMILLLLTEKWAPCIPYVKFFCLGSVIGLISTTALQTIKAVGRSDVVLKLEILKKPVFILLLLVAVRISVTAIAVTMLIYEIYGTSINMWQMKKCVGYTIKDQLADILPPLLLAGAMWWILSLWNGSGLPLILVLGIKVAVGALIYLAGSVLLRLKAFQQAKEMLVKFLHRGK